MNAAPPPPPPPPGLPPPPPPRCSGSAAAALGSGLAADRPLPVRLRRLQRGALRDDRRPRRRQGQRGLDRRLRALVPPRRRGDGPAHLRRLVGHLDPQPPVPPRPARRDPGGA